MKIYVNPLTSKQREFLESEKALGAGSAQYRKDLVHHLDKSMRYQYHILKNPHNLSKGKTYDVFNALTLKPILEFLLMNMQENSEYRSQCYDFRTVELARMAFHVVTRYLLNSPLYKTEKFVEADIDRVAYYFRTLAKHEMDKESHETISEKEEWKMTEEINQLRNDPNSDYQKLDRKFNKLIKQKNEENNPEMRKKISDEIDEVSKERKLVQDQIEKKEREILSKLSHKYDHLLNVYSPYDILGPFEYKKNPHLSDDDPENERMI